MPRKRTLADLMRNRIASNRRAAAFVREEFLDLGDYDQVGRGLRELVNRGELVRVGYGIYAKARRSARTGKPVPVKPIIAIATQGLRKVGYKVSPSVAARTSLARRSPRSAAHQTLNVGAQRVSRVIQFGRDKVVYATSTINERRNLRAVSAVGDSKVLKRLGKRYIWWKIPGSKPEVDRIIAQVMDIGTFEDVRALEAEVGRNKMKQVLAGAQPGWLSPKSWNYWHLVLGQSKINSVPQPPRRTYDFQSKPENSPEKSAAHMGPSRAR